MKKHLFFILTLAIFSSLSCFAAQKPVRSLKKLCSVVIGQNIQQEAIAIANMSPEKAAQALEKKKPFIPSWWMPEIADNTDLQWQSKQIKQTAPIKPDIKIIDGKKVLTKKAQKEFLQKKQDVEIRDMAIGSKPIHGERPLYVTHRDGKTDVFTLESGKHIASFKAPKPKLPNLISPIKDNFKWANNTYQARAVGTHVQIQCNDKLIGTIALPTTRGDKPICASSLKLALYKNTTHLFIGTDNGKLLRVAIDGTKVGDPLTLMRGPRKDSGHKKPIKDIFVTPNKQHINTTSRDSLRRGPITPSSKEGVRTILNFGKNHKHSTSSSTGDIISGGNNENISINTNKFTRSQTFKINNTTSLLLMSPSGKHAFVGTSNGNVYQFTHPHAHPLEDLRGGLVLQEVQNKMPLASPDTKKKLNTLRQLVKSKKRLRKNNSEQNQSEKKQKTK